MLPPLGNPIKCHEEVMPLQPMIPPKSFDPPPPPLTEGCSEGLVTLMFFFKSAKRPVAIPGGVPGNKACSFKRKIRTHLDLLSIPRLWEIFLNVKTFRWDQSCWTSMASAKGRHTGKLRYMTLSASLWAVVMCFSLLFTFKNPL